MQHAVCRNGFLRHKDFLFSNSDKQYDVGTRTEIKINGRELIFNTDAEIIQ